MWKHSYLVSRTCGALTNSPTGWIRAPLIKQLFSQLQNLSRVSEDILWQIAPLPYTTKFSGCEQVDLIDETKTFSILLSVTLIFLCYFHLKCFYSSREGEVDIRMAWYGWVQELFSRCSKFLSLFWSSDLCFSVWLSCITRLKFSVLFQPAQDATHKMSFTDLNTVLLCLLVDVVNRWLVLNHLYVSVFSVEINLSQVRRICWTEVVCTNWQLYFLAFNCTSILNYCWIHYLLLLLTIWLSDAQEDDFRPVKERLMINIHLHVSKCSSRRSVQKPMGIAEHAAIIR